MNHYSFYDRYIVDGACWEEHEGQRVLVADIIPVESLSSDEAFGERIVVGRRDDDIPTNEESRNAVGLFIKAAMDDGEPLSIVTIKKDGWKLERVVFVGLHTEFSDGDE